MAEALISRLLERLTWLTEQLRGEDLNLGVGVEKQIENLILNLKDVQSVLVDAEVRQLVEPAVREWLDDLERVCYEIDNVTAELSVQVKKQVAAAPGVEKKKKKNKVCLPIFSDSFCLGRGELKTISSKIGALGEELTLIAEQRFQFNHQQIERRDVAIGKIKRQKVLSGQHRSPVNTDVTFGRKDQLKFLLSKLLSVGTEQKEMNPVVVIPILGMGGIGKTTLARLAYKDDTVKTHFERRIWVTVSHPFDEVQIAKAVIEGFGLDIPHSNELQILLRVMSDCIAGRRFLLVLDDVWKDDAAKWEPLWSVLQKGAVGSTVMVTIRLTEVARMMRGTTNMIFLGRLSEEDCFSLFQNCAKFDRKKDGSQKYGPIARQLVQRCKGVPLLTKILGGLMLYKETIKEWEDVLNSQIWTLREVEEQVFQVLLLSYYDLTPTIRPCLLYCAIYPKDFQICRDNLVELWMSQDYLSPEENEDEETVGQRYFEDLVIRSFFQDLEKDEEGNIRWCRMHDIVHDFLQFLTRGEFVTLSEGSLSERESSKIRHLTLNCASQELSHEISIAINHLKDLRTITTLDSDHSTLDLHLISQQLRCLRTLTLKCGHIHEVPTSIGNLVHLRYLCLSHNQTFKKLPDTMCNLYNLQTLHLISLEQLEKLPEGMDKLSNLRNLHVIGCEELRELPEVIGKLVCLKHIDLSSSRSLVNLPNGLCYLKNLQTLRLNGCKQLVGLPKAIGKLIALEQLHVAHCDKLQYIPEGIGELVLLRYVDLSYNRALKAVPSTMHNMPNLRTLCLDGCSELVELELFLKEFGRLTAPLGCNVSYDDKKDALSMKNLGNVKDVSKAGKAELKSVVLSSLELDFDNEEDERIKGDAELLEVLRPRQVEILRIVEYHGLTVPLNWTIPLKNLRHLVLEEWTYCEVLPPLGRFPSLEILEMSGMHGLKKIGADFLGTETDDQVSFPRLKQLSFRVVQNWEEWEGVEGCTIMPVLSSLRVNSCSVLQKLPQFLWKTPLDELVIDWCPILTQDLREGGGEEWSKISHIPNITINRGITFSKKKINRTIMGRETETATTSGCVKEEDEITEVLLE